MKGTEYKRAFGKYTNNLAIHMWSGEKQTPHKVYVKYGYFMHMCPKAGEFTPEFQALVQEITKTFTEYKITIENGCVRIPDYFLAKVLAQVDKKYIPITTLDSPTPPPQKMSREEKEKLSARVAEKAALRTTVRKAKNKDTAAKGDPTPVAHVEPKPHAEVPGGDGKHSYEGKGRDYSSTSGLDQFFTPIQVAQLMHRLALQHGYSGGAVLDPAAGTGRLVEFFPPNKVTAIEPEKDAFKFLEQGFPESELYNKKFEEAFLNERGTDLLPKNKTTWLPGYPFEVVIMNPPYGKHKNIYSSYFKGAPAQAEQFFMLQSLNLIKPGGLLIAIVPHNFMSNGLSYTPVKEKILAQATLVDAYRLPNKVFAKTDIGTDIVLLKKK